MTTTSQFELHSSFARHETFHPRYGWLRKAYEAARDMNNIFLRPDATTILGVGKNMVRAIRYWGLAYKVIEEEPNEDNPRVHDVYASAFGEELFGKDGFDPYLEEPGSLWLLHWKLLSSVPICRAPAWWAIFNSPRALDFNDQTLTEELRRFCEEYPELGEVVDNSLIKDARCLLRMYGSATQGRDLPEDSIDSPFVELDLIRPLPRANREWTINRGPKRNLPDAIVAYASLDYLAAHNISGRLASLSGLTRSPGSPGRAFALTESALTETLARYANSHPELMRLTDAAGVRQLLVPEQLGKVRTQTLRSFYKSKKRAH